VSQGRDFERHRTYLWGVGYRMLGDPAEAEDVVQEAFVRAIEGRPSAPSALRPWLTKVVTNLAIDRLRRRKARAYDGPWLAVPVEELPVEDVETLGPEARYSLRESANLAFLFALESLDARSRAVLLLREVFGYRASEVGSMLELSPENVRVLTHRARVALSALDPCGAESPTSEFEETMARFNAALVAEDASALEALLVEDVQAATDAAGRYRANRKVVRGRGQVAALLRGLARKATPTSMRVASLGGRIYVQVCYDPENERDTPEAWVFLDRREAGIAGIYTISAPEKVGLLNQQLERAGSQRLQP
jgi:RNA polymerase sigma-70 factor (ECF subfamily)